jgi:hypothetical protein
VVVTVTGSSWLEVCAWAAVDTDAVRGSREQDSNDSGKPERKRSTVISSERNRLSVL